REIARQLAEDHGFLVLVGGRDLAAADRAAAEIDGEALSAQLDVTDEDSVYALRERIEADPGPLDVPVNNRRVSGEPLGVGEYDLDAAHEVVETDLFGPWRLTQAMLPLLRAGGHGRIVNVSSGAGQLSDMYGGRAAYRVSKSGLNALTRILAYDE